MSAVETNRIVFVEALANEYIHQWHPAASGLPVLIQRITMSSVNVSTSRTTFRTFVASIGITLVLMVVSCSGCWLLFGRDELLSTFTVGSYTINVYAEPAFHYEPPGYVYFELKQWNELRVPRRRFMGIGFERKPAEKFSIVTADHEGILALVLNQEVQMIHEFSSGYTWPGPYTNVTESQWQMAELLLEKLRAENPEIRCPQQEWHRKMLDHKRSK